jgi:hypothetical protein
VTAELSISGRNHWSALPGIDIARATDLRRVKALANAVLGGSLVILLSRARWPSATSRSAL